MKRLIVNADDFGLTPGVNRAIAACHQQGMVTSATLMATGAALDEAAKLAAEMPQLSVGCHVVLVDGESILPAKDVCSLLAPGTGRFYNTIGEVLRALALGRFRGEEIEAEAAAQMARLRSVGVRLSHFDSHKHTHMFPSILEPVLRAARTHGIRALRNPFEAPGVVGFAEALGTPALFVRKSQTTLLHALLRRRWLRLVHEAGLATTDGSLGVTNTGWLDERTLRSMLERMPDGTWELVCHPGYNDAELARVRTRLRESRQTEMQALKAIAPAELRSRYAVELGGFAELASAGEAAARERTRAR